MFSEVDLAVEKLILQRLEASINRYDLAVVAEESAELCLQSAHPRFHKSAFWCIDPLDGSLPFIQGKSGYAVSIALVNANGESLLGVVYDPYHQTLYQAQEGHAFKKTQLLTPIASTEVAELNCNPNQLQLFHDSSLENHPLYTALLHFLKLWATEQGLSGVQTHQGYGAVLNACQVLEHQHSLYWKLPKQTEGGGSIWDFAASSALFEHAKRPCSDSFGKPLQLNPQETLFMHKKGVLFSSSDNLHQDLLTWYKRQTQAL